MTRKNSIEEERKMTRKSRKRKLESEDQAMVNWEKENILSEELRDEMETMWEIPQIFHFLHVAKEALNVPHLSMYEMERMLLMPRASKQLANVMTCLLRNLDDSSSPIFKAKLRKIPPMPYEFWTNILMHKIKGWFKVYQTKHRDTVKVLETIGVEPEFWNVFPDASLIEGKDFEELSFKQRVWLLKTVCDCVMHARKTVQEEIMKQRCEDQFEMVLGTDRYGARFIYFPQFVESDLRVYKHCLDNKILSTVKPCKTKAEPKTEVKVDDVKKETAGKIVRIKRRKSRWRNGTLPSRMRMKRRARKHDEENSSDGKCSADSAIGSLANDDTNFSNASVCSNNNHSDVEAWTSNRLRSTSKNSDEGTMSSETKCSNAKSGDISRLPVEKMFRGFARSADNQRSNIMVIRGILDDLTSTIETDGKAYDEEEITLDKWIDKMNSSVSRKLRGDKSGVDDVKSDVIEDFSDSRKKRLRRTKERLTKSDDKTLREQESELLRNERSMYEDENEDCMRNDVMAKGSMLGETNERQVTKRKLERRWEKSNEEYKVDLECETRLKNDKSESETEEEVTLSELRDRLSRRGETPDDLQSISSSDVPVSERYNLRKLKNIKNEDSEMDAEYFERILADLSVSSFELVADSVEALRDLVNSFSSEEDKPSDNCRYTNHSRPACEVRLVKKLSELVTSLEGTESILKDSLKKARTKLYKEWTNFKEGVVEGQDQDWSGEGGHGFNWWLLGSQGHPLSCSGEATLQTLSQSALSSPGPQIQAQQSVDEFDEQCNNGHQRQCEQQTQESNKEQQQSEGTSLNEQQSNQGQDNEQTEDIGYDPKTKDFERQTGRVLRARGVSSYTEQLYSDEEIDEDQLEGWADLEAVYSTSSKPASASTVNAPAQIGSVNNQSEEDSDQDWILPGSRKRKNKRPSANRRLKSFQHKLQNIRIEDWTSSSLGVPPSKTFADSFEMDTKESRPIDSGTSETPGSNNPSNSKAQLTCKLESMDSVHSELDIKDEGPILECEHGQNVNNYNINVQQGYVVVKTEPAPMTNYYVMQQNPGVSGIVRQSSIAQQGTIVSGAMPRVQQMQQGYYVHGTQSYVVQDSQQNFVPTQQHVVEPHNPRQMIFHQAPQAVGPQQFIGQQNYVQMPYVVGAANPNVMSQPVQQSFGPRGQHFVNHGMRPNLMGAQNVGMTNKFALNRPPPPLARHNFPHPNGAVIRSNVPIKAHFPRNAGSRTLFPKNPASLGNGSRVQRKSKKVANKPSSESSAKKKTTSLIVLSDSDDEIEMIITENASTDTSSQQKQKIQSSSRSSAGQKPIVTSEITVSTSKSVLPPQIIQRMSQGGISITPVKPTPPPVQNANTQLVVVVNETGSHYALALPNGSKLILTPEQVAQIRASNGGKLIL